MEQVVEQQIEHMIEYRGLFVEITRIESLRVYALYLPLSIEKRTPGETRQGLSQVLGRD